jgi:site-specific recombinase XerD
VSLTPRAAGSQGSPPGLVLPGIVVATGERAGVRFLEFFAAAVRNPHTRRAYTRAVGDFLAWCEAAGVSSLDRVQPLHVATWVEQGTRELSAPTVKQRLAAVRDPKGPLFRTIGRGTRQLTHTPLPQANAHAMIRRRATAAGIATKIGNHSFRATGITAYLKNGGTLEKAAAMANHASTRTTQLYDRGRDDVNLDEVERVVI